MDYPSEFKSNRLGHTFQAIISSLGITLSIWALAAPLKFDKIPDIWVQATFVTVLIIALIVLYLSILRLITPLPELKYHEQGFDQKVGAYTLIHVNWEDVKDLAYINTSNEQVLAVILERPGKYIRPFRGWTSTVLKARLKNYGTPVIISAKKLHISFEQLQMGFVHYWNRYKHKS